MVYLELLSLVILDKSQKESWPQTPNSQPLVTMVSATLIQRNVYISETISVDIVIFFLNI